MKLTPKEAAEARERRMAYEANMAIEGLHIAPEDKAIIDQLDDQRIGYGEGVALVMKHLRKRGVIPSDSDKSDIAAE